MKYTLIVNPVSGKGLDRKNLDKVIRYFDKHAMDLTVLFTQGPGNATELARAAASKDADVIIGAGGDGTINEVLNGMAGSGKKLAIIPWGTGNVFAREMRFPKKIGRLCRMIRKGYTARLDTGTAGGRHFLLMWSAGFDAYSLKKMEGGRLKRFFGILAYAVGAIRALAAYRWPRLTVKLDNGTAVEGSFVLVSNTSRYGAFFTITPDAHPSDGLLDVLVYRGPGSWNFFKFFLRVLALSLGADNPVRYRIFLKTQGIYQVKKLRVECADSPALSQMDGELYHALPQDIAVSDRSVEVILPRRAAMRYNKRPVAEQ